MNYNRNFPLLTDGKSLYTIIVSFKKVKRKLKEDMKSEFEAYKKTENQDKSPDSIKKALRGKTYKKPLLTDDAKVCEFHLLEFDIDKHQENTDQPTDAAEGSLVNELFEGFSGYFTKKECLRGLRINGGDIEAASKWLLDEGENERGQIVINSKRKVLLGQSLVRDGRETDVIENSILYPNAISSGQWTMNNEQLAYHYNSSTAKIFSINEEDIKVIDITNENSSSQENKGLQMYAESPNA